MTCIHDEPFVIEMVKSAFCLLIWDDIFRCVIVSIVFWEFWWFDMGSILTDFESSTWIELGGEFKFKWVNRFVGLVYGTLLLGRKNDR